MRYEIDWSPIRARTGSMITIIVRDIFLLISDDEVQTACAFFFFFFYDTTIEFQWQRCLSFARNFLLMYPLIFKRIHENLTLECVSQMSLKIKRDDCYVMKL